MDEMKNTVTEGSNVDVQRIIEENEALRNELAKRDAKECSERQNMFAKEEMAREYKDFTEMFDEIEALLADIPPLLDLAPNERYRIGYLMLRGEKSLAKENAQPTEEEVISFLNKHPQILLHFLKGRKDASKIPGFSFDKSVGIRIRVANTPKTLTEAHNAAVRYAKIR